MNIEVKNIIKGIIKLLIEKYNPEKIILFGSCASGNYTKDSDIDLLIVTKEAENLKFKHKLINTFPLPIQLIFISNEEFEETKDVIGGIAYPASKYGKLIYEKS